MAMARETISAIIT